MNAHAKIDMTVDFEAPGELEREIRLTLLELSVQPGDMVGIHVPADSELGEMTFGDHEYTREIGAEDWTVIAVYGPSRWETARELARALRAKL